MARILWDISGVIGIMSILGAIVLLICCRYAGDCNE